MATLSELNAAKLAREAAVLAGTYVPQTNDPTEPGTSEEVTEKPLGKLPSKVLSKTVPPGESRGQKTPIRDDLEERSLARPQGEAIDMTPTNATPLEEQWHAALTMPAKNLCLMRDPNDPEIAWLAVRLDNQPFNPLLLVAFPLFNHPLTKLAPF